MLPLSIPGAASMVHVRGLWLTLCAAHMWRRSADMVHCYMRIHSARNAYGFQQYLCAGRYMYMLAYMYMAHSIMPGVKRDVPVMIPGMPMIRNT